MSACIVVIENHESTRKLLTYNFQNRGYQVFNYDYASVDVAMVEQIRPDLLILDFNVQDGDRGWDFLQMLKMEDATANIPILIMTTTTQFSAELRTYLSTHYIHVVNKPFDLDTLLSVVKRTLMLASQAGSIFSSENALPILIIKDASDSSEALITVLKLEGYQVVTIESGLHALDAVYNAEYCLILLDIAASNKDDLEFLKVYDRQLRPHIPVIILDAEADLLSRAWPSFVINTFTKPYESSQLLRIVENYAQPA